MLKINEFYPGDNLHLLSKVEGNSASLVYADPPFGTGKEYYLRGTKTVAFADFFTTRELVEFLHPRVEQVKRVLREDGCFFLHGNIRNFAYIQVLCDEIFGAENLVNTIIWKRMGGHKISKSMDNIVDTILLYAKNKDRVRLNSNVIKRGWRKYSKVERETGRRFDTQPVESSTNFKERGEVRTFYKPDGTQLQIKTNLGWKWVQETINKRWRENPYIFYFTKNGKVRYKIYEDERGGFRINNLWDDIPHVVSRASESTGFPTQKPEKLLERIIKLGSSVGDLVIDPFAGSGTTLTCSKRFNRKFIGMDNSPQSELVVRRRLKRVLRIKTLF